MDSYLWVDEDLVMPYHYNQQQQTRRQIGLVSSYLWVKEGCVMPTVAIDDQKEKNAQHRVPLMGRNLWVDECCL